MERLDVAPTSVMPQRPRKHPWGGHNSMRKDFKYSLMFILIYEIAKYTIFKWNVPNHHAVEKPCKQKKSPRDPPS